MIDLDPFTSGKILDTLHLINTRKGHGKVTSYTRVRGEMNGIAMRRVSVTHYDSAAYRCFKFRLFQGKRDGQWRIAALGVTMKLESLA